MVVAAGNDGDDGPRKLNYWGIAYNVITVGGMDTEQTETRQDDVIYKREHPGQAGSSSIGPTKDGRKKPDLVAPGRSVPIAVPGRPKCEWRQPVHFRDGNQLCGSSNNRCCCLTRRYRGY